MTEDAAREQLRAVLDSFTVGTVLHLLAEVARADAADARRAGDHAAAEQWESVGVTLFVVGLGIDAARPY